MEDILEKITQSGLVTELSTVGIVLIGMSLSFWFLVGRFRLHNMLINVYISFAILQVAQEALLEFGKFMPLLFFLVLVFFLTISDSTMFEIHLSGSGLAIWQAAFFSFLEAGLLFSIIASLMPQKQILKYFSAGSLEFFTSPLAAILWMVVPLLFLILIGRRGK